MCDGLLDTIDELQQRLAAFEEMLRDQNAAASSCANDQNTTDQNGSGTNPD